MRAIGLVAVIACGKAAPPPAPAAGSGNGVVAVGSNAAPADAAAKLALQRIEPTALPAGVTAQGSLEQAWKFEDQRGTNYVLFSAKRWETPPASRNAWLYVDHWLVPADGPAKKLIPVRELVEDCPLELTARFHDNALELTDLDHDGVGEVTLGYEVGCRSDVSANKYKLLTLVDGKMYILRGKTRFKDGDQLVEGTFEPDPIFAKGPPAFLEHAKTVWARTCDDTD